MCRHGNWSSSISITLSLSVCSTNTYLSSSSYHVITFQWRATTQVKTLLPAWSWWFGKLRKMQRSKDDLCLSPLPQQTSSLHGCFRKTHVREARSLGGGGTFQHVRNFSLWSSLMLLPTVIPFKAIGALIIGWLLGISVHFSFFHLRSHTEKQRNITGHCLLSNNGACSA